MTKDNIERLRVKSNYTIRHSSGKIEKINAQTCLDLIAFYEAKPVSAKNAQSKLKKNRNK